MRTRSVLFVFLLLLQVIPLSQAATNQSETDRILFSAESLFKNMKERNYANIWSVLSGKSKSTIVDDVYAAVVKRGASYTKETISRDFATAGVLSVSYWGTYLEVFNPDSVLEESKWEMGNIEKERAEIIIRYKKSERPALIKMFKEDGGWKVGLEETFRASRR